jgi:1-pyrroline-5-carboxylate dehydrogenase
MKPKVKITYATLRNDNDELHADFEEGLRRVRAETLGRAHNNWIDGTERSASTTFTKQSPIDGSLVGTFASATGGDVADAVDAARSAFPAWSGLPWQQRVEILRRAADAISEQQMDLAAMLSIEVGKTRLEAIGDVEETADLLRWSCDIMETNRGFETPMGNLGDNTVHTRSILKPYGVWGVISPFNFPLALSGGPASAALVAGNTVVFKPSSDTPLSAVSLSRIFNEAGLPDGVFNLVMGAGESVGAALRTSDSVAGIVFTGSYEVGFDLFKSFSGHYPKPVIVEMGGKNPVIVSRKADVDEAAEGVMRSAFGLSGQKCSATSRVYVEGPVFEEFLGLLAEKTQGIVIGDPTQRSTWMGPVINARAVSRYVEASESARRDGTVVAGGQRMTEGGLDKGLFVAPTIVTGLPDDHRLLTDELFLPFVVVTRVDSVAAALKRANHNVLGLTAGFYSEEEEEIELFLREIEAGVVYINRRAGATTGAWPGIQPFGGWKGSGSTGKAAGGYYYVQQFMREQSQTRVD